MKTSVNIALKCILAEQKKEETLKKRKETMAKNRIQRLKQENEVKQFMKTVNNISIEKFRN